MVKDLNLKPTFKYIMNMFFSLVIFKNAMIVGFKVWPKKKLFVSCNPTLTSFYSKKTYSKVFSALATPNQRKTCIKHTFLTKIIIKKKNFTDLPTLFFSDRYRKQAISLFRPK